jgi:hypothetical protein
MVHGGGRGSLICTQAAPPQPHPWPPQPHGRCDHHAPSATTSTTATTTATTKDNLLGDPTTTTATNQHHLGDHHANGHNYGDHHTPSAPSPELLPALAGLERQLRLLCGHLDGPSFRDVWRATAVPLNRFMFNHVVGWRLGVGFNKGRRPVGRSQHLSPGTPQPWLATPPALVFR